MALFSTGRERTDADDDMFSHVFITFQILKTKSEALKRVQHDMISACDRTEAITTSPTNRFQIVLRPLTPDHKSAENKSRPPI